MRSTVYKKSAAVWAFLSELWHIEIFQYRIDAKIKMEQAMLAPVPVAELKASVGGQGIEGTALVRIEKVEEE